MLLALQAQLVRMRGRAMQAILGHLSAARTNAGQAHKYEMDLKSSRLRPNRFLELGF